MRSDRQQLTVPPKRSRTAPSRSHLSHRTEGKKLLRDASLGLEWQKTACCDCFRGLSVGCALSSFVLPCSNWRGLGKQCPCIEILRWCLPALALDHLPIRRPLSGTTWPTFSGLVGSSFPTNRRCCFFWSSFRILLDWGTKPAFTLFTTTYYQLLTIGSPLF